MKHVKSKRSVCVVPAKPQHPCPPNVGEGGVPHLAQPVLLLWDRGGHSNDWQVPAKTNPGPENRRSCVMAGESAPREAAIRAGKSSFQEGGESHLPPPFWSSTFPNSNPLSNVVADHDCLTAPHCAFLKHRTAGDKARTKAGQFSKPDARFGRAALGRRLSPMRGRRQGRLVASLCVNRPPALGGRCSKKRQLTWRALRRCQDIWKSQLTAAPHSKGEEKGLGSKWARPPSHTPVPFPAPSCDEDLRPSSSLDSSMLNSWVRHRPNPTLFQSERAPGCSQPPQPGEAADSQTIIIAGRHLPSLSINLQEMGAAHPTRPTPAGSGRPPAIENGLGASS